MGKLYEDNSIKVDCEVTEEYIDNYNQNSEPLFTEMLPEFHIYLGCGYIHWRGQHSTCVPIELTFLEIKYRKMIGKIWVKDSSSHEL